MFLSSKYYRLVAETETQAQIQSLQYLLLWMKLRTISIILVMLFLLGSLILEG